MRVLLIEDEPDIASFVKKGLGEASSHGVEMPYGVSWSWLAIVSMLRRGLCRSFAPSSAYATNRSAFARILRAA